LLDVGCGSGYHLARLRRRGYDAVGLDGSAAMLVQARAHAPGLPVVIGDVESLPFPAQSFDVVVCIEVLRYLRDTATCINEIARVLRPGGACLVTATPRLNLNGYWAVNRLATFVPLRRLSRLMQYFTSSRALRRVFRSAGFAEPTIHGVYFGPVNWVERLAPSRLPGFLQQWERFDTVLANTRILREFANMFLVFAKRC
jgi:2-polyprenyl-6-hydroxyphenyl methylase/3-demethylubiquinone-9 3-methyltransferase